jgi:hypothetical protein
MKKITGLLFSFFAFAIILSACSSSKSTTTTNVSRGKFVGTWTVSNVTYDGLVSNAVQTVFDQAPPNDFVNSTWKLTNDGNGTYTLSNGASQKIYWSVNNAAGPNQLFQFKKLFEGDKAQKVTTGYQLVVASNDGKAMVLKTPIAIGNSTGHIIYSFAKQ